jgi:hypothetical protein
MKNIPLTRAECKCSYKSLIKIWKGQKRGREEIEREREAGGEGEMIKEEGERGGCWR